MTDYALILDYYDEDGGPPWAFGSGVDYPTLEATWRDERTIPSQVALDDLWDLTFPDGPSSGPTEQDIEERGAINNFSPLHEDLYTAILDDNAAAYTAIFASSLDSDVKDALGLVMMNQLKIMQALHAMDHFLDIGDDVPDEPLM